MRKLDIAALVLVIVGAINWDLVALGAFNLVTRIVGLSFGVTNTLSGLVSGLVGLSRIWIAIRFKALVSNQTPMVTAGIS